MHDPETEPVPERFDIHVMAFADSSVATVAALAKIFAIDGDDAARLVADAPVVVKRAAPPDVADALLDVLARLGAQVVILPAQGAPPLAPSEPPQRASGRLSAPADAHDEEDDDERDFFAAEERASGRPAQGWGGLDLSDHAPQPHASVLAQPPRSPPSASLSVPPRLPPMASITPPVRAAPVASITPPLQAAPVSFAPPTSSRPPSLPESDRPEPRAAARFGEASSLPPTAADDALELAVPMPGRPLAPPRERSLPPPIPPVGFGASRSLPTAARPSPVPSQDPRLPDLGLGSVPPLPPLGSLPPLPPLQAASQLRPPTPAGIAPVSAKGPRRDTARGGRAAAPTPDGARTGGKLTGGAAAQRPGPVRAPAALTLPMPPAGWMSRTEIPAGPDLERSAATVASSLSDESHEAPASSLLVGMAEAPRARPLPPSRSAVSRPRGVALIELLFGIAVLAAGVHFGKSMLHGAADALWLVLHGFALYGIGAGLIGLRP